MTDDPERIARINYRAGIVGLIAGLAIFVVSLIATLNCISFNTCSSGIQWITVFNLANGVIVSTFGVWQIRKHSRKKPVEVPASVTPES